MDPDAMLQEMYEDLLKRLEGERRIADQDMKILRLAYSMKDELIKQKEDTIKQKEDTIKQKEEAIKQKEDLIRKKDLALDNLTAGYSASLSQKEILIKDLQDLLERDSLTGLYNRKGLERNLGETLKRAAMLEYRGDALLITIDANQFNVFNNTYGHVAGDTLLQRIGQYLTGKVKISDVVARPGGDEYSMILYRVKTTENGLGPNTIGEKLQGIVGGFAEHTKDIDEHGVVSLSLGAAFLRPWWSAEEAKMNADRAMYYAKYSGSGWHLWQENLDYTAFQRMHGRR